MNTLQQLQKELETTTPEELIQRGIEGMVLVDHNWLTYDGAILRREAGAWCADYRIVFARKVEMPQMP